MFNFLKRRQDQQKPLAASLRRECNVRDFFVLRDVLFCRGNIQRENDEIPEIWIKLWDNSRHRVPLLADDFNPSSTDNLTFSFRYLLPPGVASESIEQISILFVFRAGVFEKGGFSQEAISKDPFLNSEKEYWEHVHTHPRANILEIGSRARSGINRRGLFPANSNYTGFDICAGENVDVVGDAHLMSRVLPANHFDIVFSVSVWEHLSMPWVVSLELNKVMKVGGIAMINTHQSWPSHEEPWDYFRFSDFSWDSLFNSATGFEILNRGTGIPCVMGASQFIPSIHASRIDWHYGYLATRCVVKKVGETQLQWNVDPEITRKGRYSH